jgi:hypothetical protein
MLSLNKMLTLDTTRKFFPSKMRRHAERRTVRECVHHTRAPPAPVQDALERVALRAPFSPRFLQLCWTRQFFADRQVLSTTFGRPRARVRADADSTPD